MAQLYGREWTRRELLDHVGDLSQVAGIRLCELSDGAERGVRVAQIRSGSGFNVDVLLDRGMDLGMAEFRGIPLGWASPVGAFPHPAFYEPEGKGWHRTWGGGLLTGCGLTQVGQPNIDNEETLGQHGRLSVLPARRVQYGEDWMGDECLLWLQGQVRQAWLIGENLLLTRRLEIRLGTSTLSLRDVIENLGRATSPLMLLYHLNLGFPLLDSHARLLAEPHPVRLAATGLEAKPEDWQAFPPPLPSHPGQVYIHDLPTDVDGWAAIRVANAPLDLGFTLRFTKSSLPNLFEWQFMRQGAFVLGLEPANCMNQGRAQEREAGTLPFIEPGERREFALEIAASSLSHSPGADG